MNLDKLETINAHRLGSGVKIWEQLANQPGVGAALVILLAAQRERRGGGDLDIDSENWHGPERDQHGKHGACPGPMPRKYPAIAKRTIGRWAGDRIAFVGDYAKDSDLPSFLGFEALYGREDLVDISEDVAAVIEHELCGRFTKERGFWEWNEEPSNAIG